MTPQPPNHIVPELVRGARERAQSRRRALLRHRQRHHGPLNEHDNASEVHISVLRWPNALQPAVSLSVDGWQLTPAEARDTARILHDAADNSDEIAGSEFEPSVSNRYGLCRRLSRGTIQARVAQWQSARLPVEKDGSTVGHRATLHR